MNLIGKIMRHKVFGSGPVVQQDEQSLTVDFLNGSKKLIYDKNTFTKFLAAEDSVLQKAILQEFEDIKQDQEQKRIEEDLAKQKALEEQAAVAAAKKRSGGKTSAKKAAVKHERIPGKRMTFYVFQGNTFDRESKGGYLWAPISSKDGGVPHHWERLLDVRKGDIILHGCKAQVQAVSVAKDQCYDCRQPEELRTEDLWEQEGRRVDCEYIVLDEPVKTALFREDIIRLCNVKYAPFDKDGNGNTGYLFELNRELARIFLRGVVKCNPELASVDYIAELLAEEKQ